MESPERDLVAAHDRVPGGVTQELPGTVHERIVALSGQGDAFAEDRRYDEAIAAYNQAWAMVPDPKTDWTASTWLLAAIGDACFRGGYFESAREALDYAMHCPDAIGNPFIHLRLGQVRFEKGDPDGAADELIRAYMGAGPEIFEDEDPKYLTFLSTRAKLD